MISYTNIEIELDGGEGPEDTTTVVTCRATLARDEAGWCIEIEDVVVWFEHGSHRTEAPCEMTADIAESDELTDAVCDWIAAAERAA